MHVSNPIRKVALPSADAPNHVGLGAVSADFFQSEHLCHGSSEQCIETNLNQLRVDVCTCSRGCALILLRRKSKFAKIPSGKTPPEERRSASQRIQKHIRKVALL